MCDHPKQVDSPNHMHCIDKCQQDQMVYSECWQAETGSNTMRHRAPGAPRAGAAHHPTQDTTRSTRPQEASRLPHTADAMPSPLHALGPAGHPPNTLAGVPRCPPHSTHKQALAQLVQRRCAHKRCHIRALSSSDLGMQSPLQTTRAAAQPILQSCWQKDPPTAVPPTHRPTGTELQQHLQC